MRCFPAVIAGILFAASAMAATGQGDGYVPVVAGVHEDLTPADRKLARTVFQKALETRVSNMSVSWSGESGNSGSVTPIRTFRAESGYFCRRFREIVVTVDDRVTTATGTACRLDDGHWERVSP